MFGSSVPIYSPIAALARTGGGNTNTSLSAFTANSVSVTDGQTVNYVNGTISVAISATVADSGATIGTPSGTISGFTFVGGVASWSQDSLEPGNNAVSFTVTASNGFTQRTYTLTLHVLTAGTFAVLTIYRTNGTASPSGGTWTIGDWTGGPFDNVGVTNWNAGAVQTLNDMILSSPMILTATTVGPKTPPTWDTSGITMDQGGGPEPWDGNVVEQSFVNGTDPS